MLHILLNINTMATVDVTISIPAGREESAAWIRKQSPEIAADALQLTAHAFAVLQTEAAGGDVARLHQEKQTLLREFDAERKNNADKVAEAERACFQAHQEEVSLERCAHLKEVNRLQHAIDSARLEASEECRLHLVTAREVHTRELESMRAECAQQAEVKVNMLQQDIQGLSTELQKRRGDDALIRSEVMSTYDLQRKSDLVMHEEKITRAREDYERQLASLEDRLKEVKEREQDSVSYFKSQLDLRTKSLEQTERENKERLAECTARMESTLTSFRGSTAVGKLGENMVMRVFAELNLGTWHDESGQQAEGRADALWTYTPTNCSKLSALVEIKSVAALHSEKDLAKFDRDINAGVRSSRINGAVFISLCARVPGTRQLDMRIEHGTPVLWASRSADDELPAKNLIEFAFLAFAQSWPVLCRQRGDAIESTVEAVSSFLDGQLADFERFSKRIESVEKISLQLQREVSSMKKIRDNLVSGVDNIRLKYPNLTPQAVEDAEPSLPSTENAWESAYGVEILEAIRTWRRDKGGGRRYPKLMGELSSLSEEAVAFASRIPGAFTIAIVRVKDEMQSTKRKRTTGDDA